jgi:hypothetical protein
MQQRVQSSVAVLAEDPAELRRPQPIITILEQAPDLGADNLELKAELLDLRLRQMDDLELKRQLLGLRLRGVR